MNLQEVYIITFKRFRKNTNTPDLKVRGILYWQSAVEGQITII